MRLTTFLTASALAALLAGPVAGAGDEFALLHSERIGDLRDGLPESALKGKIDCQPTRGPEELWGADGAWHQDWVYKDCGIVLGMASGKKGGRKSIESISMSAPSTLSTKQGIKIGSTEAEVRAAYQRDWNKDESGADDFVAGSLYGGLIFKFEGGKVTSIFLGASAE